MKFLRGGLMMAVSLTSVVALSPLARAATASAGDADGPSQLLTELQMSSITPMETSGVAASAVLSAPNWTFGARKGASIGVQETPSPTGSGMVAALRGTYPIPAYNGADYLVAAWHVPAAQYGNLEDVYIEFWAKMPGVKEGCKFVKIFGNDTAATGFADTTFATDYTGAAYGAIRQVSFGDGSTIANDTQQVINLAGSGQQHRGNQPSTAVVNTPQQSYFSAEDWGTGWHHFRIHVKFNSGTTAQNKVPDGEYYLEIDGKVYVDATGLYNRNPANGPINRIEFFGWAQTEPQAFELWYDDIRISTGGFMSTSTPMPNAPADLGVK